MKSPRGDREGFLWLRMSGWPMGKTPRGGLVLIPPADLRTRPLASFNGTSGATLSGRAYNTSPSHIAQQEGPRNMCSVQTSRAWPGVAQRGPLVYPSPWGLHCHAAHAGLRLEPK